MTALETGSTRAPSAAALRRARRFRLPSTTRPTEVDLHLEIDPVKSQRFSGQLRIGLSLTRGTRTLILHAVGLEITEPWIEAGGERLAGEITLDPLREIVRIRFPRTLARGEARLALNFSGPLRDDLMGLHRIDTAGRSFVFSQLCTTRARNVFPCFDEPGYKARYQLSVTTAASHEVISNMPAERVEPGRGGRATVQFERTPPLSTYLLAVALGELEISRSVYAGKTEIRVITTPGKARLAELALEVAKRALPLLERWFELPYPYPKLDLVAVPQFSFGAMENAGAVFFRETLLLADTALASFEERKRLTETVCHELAHMWFGDLVTMAWWDDLWLNESFATWMAFHAVDELYPELSSWQAFQHRKDAALDLDALEHTHPVYMHVASAEEADENFDLITYEKGASVIRMLAGFLGPEMFQQGVRKYIKAHAEGNATAADLWAALESVSDVPVARIMRAWIEQSGHPHVRVSRASRNGRAGILLEQSLHRTVATGAADEDEDKDEDKRLRWPVPWIGHAGQKRDGTPRLVKHIVEKKRDFVELDDVPWVYGNGEEAGFYRAWHDEHEDALLRTALDDLSTTERQGYVGHQWALVQAGLVPVGSLLALIERLGSEEDADVLQAVETPLAALGRGLVHDLGGVAAIGYREWIVASFGPALDSIGTARRKRDSEALRRRRAQLLGLVAVLGQSHHHEIDARGIALRVLAGRHDVDPELVSAWLMAAARDGDAALHDAFADAIRRAPTPQERQRALFALTEFGDPELVDRTLEWCVTGRVSNQDLVFVLGRCLAQPTAQQRSWTFIQDRWDELSQVLPPYHASRLIAATAHLRSTRQQREVIRFFKALSLPSTRRALQQTRERFAGHARLKGHAGADSRSLGTRRALAPPRSPERVRIRNPRFPDRRGFNMANEESRAGQDAFLAKTLEASIRIGLVVVLIAWCFLIVKPFIAPVLWGIVIAISSRSVYERLLGWSGGRNSIAAPAFVGLGLFFVIGPAVGLAGTMAEGAEAAVDALQADTFSVPPPPEGIADWPVIGPSIDQTWTLASTNLSALIAQFGDELKNLGGWLLNLAASIGASVLLFSFSIVIAAIFHVNAEGAGRVAQLVARRVAGAHNGPRLNELAQSTIRSVTRGILGVAMIQALAAGVGMLAVGVPGAGLWALLVLLLAVMQIPTIAILLPVALYVSSYATTGIAVIFAIWCGLVAFSDNVLKPILLGRGSDVPMLVILIGALGGFAFQGLIGLFIGPIVLSVAYTLTVAWIHDDEDADAREASEA